jgi:hypothetical protein
MSRREHNSTIISTKQMREAIKKSGYLLEQRVEPIIRDSFGYVETNPIYQDQETGKACEIDLYALSAMQVYKEILSFIFPYIICECENNSQPTVFFIGEYHLPILGTYDFKMSGIPIKLWDEKKSRYQNVTDLMDLKSFHHYCTEAYATQYCNFQMKKDRSDWMALHVDVQHETFNKLIKAMNDRINRHYKSLINPKKPLGERFNIQIYYPTVILQGNLFTAHLKNNRLTLKKTEHVQFRKQFINPDKDKVETYQIDVIVESFLPRYIKILKNEIKKITEFYQNKKPVVCLSIEKIIEDAKKLKDKPTSYRDVFEL